MIRVPVGWVQHFGAQLLTMYPPRGGGRIRFFERIRPLRTFSQVIRHVLDTDPAFRVTSMGDPRAVVTSEGEHGAYVRINGTRDGGPAQRFVGAVFGDEFVAALDGLVVVAAEREVIDQACQRMLLESSFALGIRRRRYLYAEPAGWQAIPNGLVANWYPPEFPRDRTNIVVLPAEPLRADVFPSLEAMLASERERGVEPRGDVAEHSIETASGMKGTRWSFQVARPEVIHREIVTFMQAPYSYMMRIETTSPEHAHHETFLAMVRSIQPVPAQARGKIEGDSLAAFAHMGD